MKKLTRLRLDAFAKQRGRCAYCRQPMWTRDAGTFAKRFHLSLRQALRLQATAEHLIPRWEGGADIPSNIVAACRFCNWTRHRSPDPLPWPKYGEKVAARMSAHRWHGIALISI
ncbi:MAG: HNH endonuclease [Alphaproteobacteria bacterium]|nr:HNH endonuclease [Alphaproteobacteria bacterium]MBU0832099.1 HNH endonuclease [Alphaproteobacteria bacterium]MBU1769915.1 HNH endonuclease [Alphaproteobacteria bacterium]